MQRRPVFFGKNTQAMAALLLALLTAIFAHFYPLSDFFWKTCNFGGVAFMNALKLLIVPLVVTTLIRGMLASNGAAIGKMGRVTFVYVLVTGVAAIAIGMSLALLTQPGCVAELTAQKLLGNFQSTFISTQSFSLLHVLENMLPANICATACDNQRLLGLLVFTLLFGWGARQLPSDMRETQRLFWNGAANIILHVARIIMAWTPLGIYCLVTPILYQTGLEAIRPLSVFVYTVLLGLVFLLLFFGLLLRYWARTSPWEHFKRMTPALLTAFSSASSAATVPVTLEALTACRTSHTTASFTVPLCTSINLCGTIVYECVTLVFIAQLYGVTQGFILSAAVLTHTALMTLITSFGMAGIPSASLIVMGVILHTLGLPPESLAIIWATDRILDMCRTSVNVFSSSCCALVVDRQLKI